MESQSRCNIVELVECVLLRQTLRSDDGDVGYVGYEVPFEDVCPRFENRMKTSVYVSTLRLEILAFVVLGT